MNPQASITMNPFSVTGEPLGISCITYSLWDDSIATPANFVSPYITMTTYPTLKLGPTTGSEIGT